MLTAVLETARLYDEPVCVAEAIGAGDQMMRVWLFPDGEQEVLPVGLNPIWPSRNHVRDAVRANQ